MNFGGWRLLTDEPTLPRTKPRGWGLRVGGWGLGVGGWGLGVFWLGVLRRTGSCLQYVFIPHYVKTFIKHNKNHEET